MTIKFSEQQEEEIIDLYKNKKLSMKEVSIKFKYSVYPIRRVLLKNYIIIFSKSFRLKNNKYSKRKDLNEEEIISLYNNKQSSYKISKIKNCCSSTIRNILKKHGFDLLKNKKILLKNNIPSEISKEKNRIKHLNKKATDITKQKLRDYRSKQIFPIKDTKIEIKIQNFLKEVGIEFFTHKYIKEIKHGYQCDILIPSIKLVIECDGNYWHKYPIGREIDHIRTSELLEKGFKVLRLWEHEIKDMDLNKFEEKLEKVKNE